MSEERHVVPVTMAGQPEHTTDGFCWCQPITEDVLPNGRIYIHRRTLDGPHIEPERGVAVTGEVM